MASRLPSGVPSNTAGLGIPSGTPSNTALLGAPPSTGSCVPSGIPFNELPLGAPSSAGSSVPASQSVAGTSYKSGCVRCAIGWTIVLPGIPRRWAKRDSIYWSSIRRTIVIGIVLERCTVSDHIQCSGWTIVAPAFSGHVPSAIHQADHHRVPSMTPPTGPPLGGPLLLLLFSSGVPAVITSSVPSSGPSEVDTSSGPDSGIRIGHRR